ncbi:MAG TPA: hypothetical protein VMU30_08380 [Bacteroidota bacterium]|nr:hypothetical protein [Bacteroidota bacterium]
MCNKTICTKPCIEFIAREEIAIGARLVFFLYLTASKDGTVRTMCIEAATYASRFCFGLKSWTQPAGYSTTSYQIVFFIMAR